MKKILLIFVLVTVFMPLVNAQSVGEKWIGGSIGFTTNKENDEDRTYNYNITPEFGYILTDKLALGIAIGYDHSEYNRFYSANGEHLNFVAKKNGYTINPFVRYTFLKGNIGGLFIDGGVKYGYYKEDLFSYEIESHEIEAGFRPGVAVVLSSKLSLIGRFGFLGYERRFSDDSYRDSFGFNFDMKNVSLGVNVVF